MKVPVWVYKMPGIDCSNNGITSNNSRLTLGDEYDDSSDLVVSKRIINGELYVSAIPRSVLKSDKWSMAGGNFIYSNDAMYKELTYTSYPIPVHDRIEG